MLGMLFYLLLIRESFQLGKTSCILEEPHCSLQIPRQMDTCEEWNSACIAKDNLIKAISDTVDLDQCKKHCLEFDECKFISFFGPNSFPLSNHCMLLKNCKKRHSCDDCHSINRNCFNSCTNSINGRMANNTLEIIAEVQDETLCSASCQKNVNCKFYT